MHGKPVRTRRCPRNGKQAGIASHATAASCRGKAAIPILASPETDPDAKQSLGPTPPEMMRGLSPTAACGDARRPMKEPSMKTLHIAGLAGLASLVPHAQVEPPELQQSLDAIVASASPGLNPLTSLARSGGSHTRQLTPPEPLL